MVFLALLPGWSSHQLTVRVVSNEVFNSISSYFPSDICVFGIESKKTRKDSDKKRLFIICFFANFLHFGGVFREIMQLVVFAG